MKFFLMLIAILSLPVFAENQPWHMISFGRNGLGWTATAEELDTKSNSNFKSVDYFLSDLAINYAYRLSSRVQLGSFYQNGHSEYSFKTKDGSKTRAEIETNTFGLFSLYNFSNDLNDSWYVGYSFAIANYEEENSEHFEQSEGKGPFELDDISTTHELIVGKRFSLRGFNVDNLAYSPQLRFFHRNHGKDFDDQHVGSGTGLNIQPIRFDLLF